MTTHPDFSGVWSADFGRSSLEIQAPTSTEFTIRHEEPSLVLSRTHRAAGYEDTFTLELLTDGREQSIRKGDAEIRCRCTWQGESLRFESRILGGGAEALNIVVYTLSEDGRGIVTDERYSGPDRSYRNRWVLVRRDV